MKTTQRKRTQHIKPWHKSAAADIQLEYWTQGGETNWPHRIASIIADHDTNRPKTAGRNQG